MYKINDPKYLEIAPQLVLWASGSACLNLEELSASSAAQEMAQITSSSSQCEFTSSAESQLDPAHLLRSPRSLWAHRCALPLVQTAPANNPPC